MVRSTPLTIPFANDNLDLTSDPLNHTTDQNVDALNRPNQTTQDVGGLAVLTKYQYDARDNLTQVTNPKGLNTTYTYNGLSDVIAELIGGSGFRRVRSSASGCGPAANPAAHA